MNWKTLGKAILVMVGLLAITALIALIIHVLPLWISLAIAFCLGVAVVYRTIEKEDDYSDNDSNDDDEQAEKDLALTIEDMGLLHTFLYAVKNNKQGMFTFTRLSDEQYEEVLRRFQNYKTKKKEEHGCSY